jgi:hypothetical protein
MSSIDTNAWVVFDGTALGIAGSPFADSPGIGYRFNLQDVNLNGNSLLQLYALPVRATFPLGPGQGGPVSLPLSGGSVAWRTMQMLYGTVEISAKATGTNTHPAFYMLGSNAQQTADRQSPNVVNFPLGSEIDIFEGFGGSNTTTVQQGVFPAQGGHTGFATPVTDFSQNFHTYKIVWLPGSLTFFVDGVQTGQVTVNVPSKPMFLIMDIECADASSGDVNTANFPQVMQIDYVRVLDQFGTQIFFDDFTDAPAIQNLSMSNLTFIQAASQQTDSGTTVTKAFGTSTTGKSYLLAFTLFNGTPSQSATVSDTLGHKWELISSYTINGLVRQLWQVRSSKAPGGANTVVMTSPNSLTFGMLGIAEYTGQPGAAIDAIALWKNGSFTAAVTTNNVVTNFPNETLVMFVRNGDGLAGTFNGGMVSRLSGIGSQLAMGDIQQLNAGTFSGSYTQGSAGGGWESVLVALKSNASIPSVYSPQDSRDYNSALPNACRNIQNTLNYDVATVDSRVSPNVPVDSRVSPNVPVDSRVSPNKPQNSRTPGTFGPGQ